MNQQFELYKDLIESDVKTALGKLNIEKDSENNEATLWDLVVITAISQSQKTCYQRQIERKLVNNRLPKCFEFVVISDPDNSKIGSGGSTMNLINVLYERFGDSLYSKKILLIHCGGYSQRIPYNTVLGKIFAPVPCESDYINDFLDVKLAVYTPFSVNMKPGIFLASSDIIISANIEEQIESGALFGKDDNAFVLPSHKVSLQVGKDHGIYAIHPTEQNTTYKSYECQFVLQKPSIDKMKNTPNVVQHNTDGSEYVNCDSTFYFSHAVTKLIQTFSEKYLEYIIKEKIEVDGYRDFLQPLGSNPISLDEFLATTKSTLQIFKDLYEAFKGLKTIVLALTDSEFFHLGTIHELLEFYLSDDSIPLNVSFRKSINFTTKKFNSENITNFDNLQGRIYYSKVNDQVKQSPKSLMEYCLIDEGISLELNNFSYINNCMLKVSELNNNETKFCVPNDICMHTISIKDDDGHLMYVTIFFHRNDDLKKPFGQLTDLKFLGQPLPECLISVMETPAANSVWNLKIFQAADTMSQAFAQSLKFIECFMNGNGEEWIKDLKESSPDGLKLLSLFDLLRLQNYEEMIKFREENQLI